MSTKTHLHLWTPQNLAITGCCWPEVVPVTCAVSEHLFCVSYVLACSRSAASRRKESVSKKTTRKRKHVQVLVGTPACERPAQLEPCGSGSRARAHSPGPVLGHRPRPAGFP